MVASEEQVAKNSFTPPSFSCISLIISLYDAKYFFHVMMICSAAYSSYPRLPLSAASGKFIFLHRRSAAFARKLHCDGAIFHVLPLSGGFGVVQPVVAGHEPCGSVGAAAEGWGRGPV